jgi:hypothetical protein
LDLLDRNPQDLAFCAGKFLPRSLRSLVLDSGESAYRRLGSKDAELDRHLPLPRDLVGKGRTLVRMSRFVDDLGESVQVSAALGAATLELLDGYKVLVSILNDVMTLNQALSISFLLGPLFRFTLSSVSAAKFGVFSWYWFTIGDVPWVHCLCSLAQICLVRVSAALGSSSLLGHWLPE